MSVKPLNIFQTWFTQAQQFETEPERMTLATVGEEGMPNARTVLLKQVDERGLVFYTNLRSQKAKELSQNPQGALMFYWPNQQRQVRIQGRVERVSDEEADAYFQTRPRGSQIGAWASSQSQIMANYQQLLDNVSSYTAQFEGQMVPRPPFWSGYRVIPCKIEFWEGGEYRLHKRTQYSLEGHTWKETLLFP